jgi:glycosyltransferase involved in cell wall biosynthesis
MKIAVYHNLPSGGAKRILYEQIKGLSKDHQIYLYELTTNKEDFLDISKFCIKTYKYRFNVKSNLQGPFKRLDEDFRKKVILKYLHRKIASDIDQAVYNIVIAHTDVYTESPFLLRYLKTPSIYYCEELLRIAYEPELTMDGKIGPVNKLYEKLIRNIGKSIDKKNARSADLILTTSNFMKSKILSAYGKDAHVCYPGVDTDIFKPQHIKHQNKILFIGNKNKIDGYFLVKKALSLINKEIRPQLKVLSFSSNGPIIKNDKELVKEYSSSLCTVCTDIAEPFGLKVIESLSCGTPVIAVDEGGYKETVDDSKTGYLIKRDPKILRDLIVKLYKNPPLVKRMSNYSIGYVKNNWNWTNHNNCLNKILNNYFGNDLLISGQDSGGYGGSEKFLIDLSNELRKKNIHIAFSTVKNSKLGKFLKKEKFMIFNHPFRMDILGGIRGLIKFVVFFPISVFINFKMLINFKKSGGRTVLIPGFSDKIIVTPIAHILAIKVIWIEYAPLESVFKRNFGIPKVFYKLVKKYADGIICPTNNTYVRLIKTKIFNKSDLEIIPIGIKLLSKKNIRDIKKEGLLLRNKMGLKKKLIIGMISRIEKDKGQDTLIKSTPYIKSKDIQVLIIGEGDIQYLRNIIDKLNLESKVKILGFVNDVYKYLSFFDVFVFPTRWDMEGFGIAPLEALMFDVPVVASNFGPVPEVLNNSALLVKSNEKSLAKGIDSIVNRRIIRENIIEKYNIENIAKEYIKIINTL